MTQIANNNQSHHDDCLFSMEHLYEAALGIVEPEDRKRLEHHLAECDVCRAELAELDATVNLLPLAVDQVEPHPDVKHTLLNRINAEISNPASSTTTNSRKPIKIPSSVASHPSRRPLWAFGSVFAGVFVALLVIGLWNLLPIVGDDNNGPRGQMSVLAMEKTSNCQDCHENTRGHIGADLETSDGMVAAWNLDPNQKHEVWCVNRDGKRIMVGELIVDDTGGAMQTMQFPESVGEYDQIYVARNDGTEELTVAPNKMKQDSDSDATPPD